MSLQTQARAALAAIIAAQPEATAAIVVGAATTTGFLSNLRGAGDLSAMGEDGTDTRTIWVSAGDITATPARGATITVGGVPVIVLSTRTDPAGAVLTIDYQLTRPVTE